MHSLITFATQWGSKLGGINSFNTDFLEAFGAAYYNSAQVICIVANATDAEIMKASSSHVILLSLPYSPLEKTFTKDQAQAGIDLLKKHGISFEPERTLWLGHDRITGAAAIEAAKIAGGRSALIHHMSYDHYESFAEDSRTAYIKTQEQQKLFEQSNLILAIGPLLRDAAQDLVGESKLVHMLIPGLAEIEVRSAPKTFVAFLSGRLSADAARIKQSHLGIAAFAHAHKKACQNNMPDGLYKQPKLMLRGVDYAVEVTATQLDGNPETELKAFAEEYAGRAINLQALPYTQDREELHGNISRASAALMPSWHEGFGLVAWEAIAAGVPLIISKQSGVYRLLEEKFPGSGTGCVHPIDVHGSSIMPFFRQEDLDSVAEALKNIAHQPEKARQQAGALRGLLINDYTWSTCVAKAAIAFGWPLQKDSLPPAKQKPIAPTPVIAAPQAFANDLLVHMPVKHWQAGTIVADSQLLRAEEALVPFESARQPELDKLAAWLDDTQYPQAVRLLTGAGGLGKTRLALHLCEQRIVAGWYAGFLASEFDTKSLTTSWHALRALMQPLFIVVDYAETRQDDLLALIKAILQSPTDLPVRLLLLARDGGEWWDSLAAKNQICEPLLSGYATSGPYHLPPLHNDIQDRQQAYRQALHVFAEALSIPFPNVIPALEGEHFGRPLYLQMAALLALHGERPTTAQGLTRALLNHERRYWRGLFSGHALAEPERHAEQLLALTTLAGGFATPKAVLPHWKRVSGTVFNSAQVVQLFHALIPLYPGKQGLQAVRPDLLGEALVAQALLRPSAADLLDAVLGADADKSMRSNALTVLARLSDNYQELHENLIEGLKRNFVHCWHEFILVAVETPSNLPELAEVAFDRLASNIKNQIAGLLKSRINDGSVQLAQFYCLVSKSLVDKISQKYLKKNNDIESIHNYAGALNNYGNRLSDTGRNEEALELALQALEIHQRLARKNPDRFEPDHAMSLNNYANHLSDAGRNEEALEFALQALEIRQRLARKNPDRFEPGHATSLNNYASHLSDAGRNEEALEHARQALEIYQRLARKNPDRFEPDHATSLDNYAGHLSNAGRYEEALEPARQALEIRQRLARKNPDRFEPDHATSLSNYARHLNYAGRNEEALEHARQASEIRQRLARKNPDCFEPDHATSLNNYASYLSDAGRNEEALEHARQALAIHQPLAQKNPDRFEPDHAASLSNDAAYLSDAGRNEEALEHARQALEIHQRLVRKNRDRFEPDHATSLCNYASHLSDAGRNEEALEHARQALEIHQRLVRKNRDRFERDHVTSLSNYASRLSDAGRNEEALEHARQALEIHQRLVRKNRDRFEPDHARSLGNYASHLSDAGRNEEALEHARQALEIHQRLVRKNRDRFEPDYARSLSNYANRLSDAGRYEEAKEHARKALEIHQRLARRNPAVFEEIWFSTVCNTHFQEWMAGDSQCNGKLAKLESLPESTQPHRRPVLQLYVSFVRACCSSDETGRSNAFKQVTSVWSDLSISNRISAQNHWMCAAAWCATYEPLSEENTDWQAEWHQFIKQRQGHVPCWMLEVARRLKFKWPE